VPNPPPDDSEPAAQSAPATLPEPAASSPEPAPEREPATRSTTGMWAVQLGSFSNEANAERLAADLRQQGFAAFLSKTTTEQGELHRVRVGPQRDRESAETMLARLERAGQKGQVVPHP
jgi:DedD protein